MYRFRDSAGVYAVATRPAARGQGAASELVRFATSTAVAGDGVRYSIFADSTRLERRLDALGFRAARSFREYELPLDAELSMPPVPGAAPPRWRPPRGGGTRSV